ncbi:MAG TPA: ABC transporter substrate-binding protein [Thermoleophilaceae bacterium]|nr:ABC transporter substrate-binding protein [Thermoleophilaceae bacterium]
MRIVPFPSWSDPSQVASAFRLGISRLLSIAVKDPIFGTATDYSRDYEKRFGKPAEYHSAEAAAACLALVLAVEKAGSADPKKARDALADLDTPSFFGPIKFNERGQNVTKPMSAIQIQNGEVTTIYPKDQAEAKLQWPGTGG